MLGDIGSLDVVNFLTGATASEKLLARPASASTPKAPSYGPVGGNARSAIFIRRRSASRAAKQRRRGSCGRGGAIDRNHGRARGRHCHGRRSRNELGRAQNGRRCQKPWPGKLGVFRPILFPCIRSTGGLVGALANPARGMAESGALWALYSSVGLAKSQCLVEAGALRPRRSRHHAWTTR